MKKIVLTLISAAIAQSAFCWELTFTAGTFFTDAEGTKLVDEAYNFALIVDTRKDDDGNWKNFEDFSLTVGDSFSQNTWINDNQEFKTLVTGSLDPEYEFAALGNESWKGWSNSEFGFEGGENVAIVVWNSTESYEVEAGDKYVVVSPQILNDTTQEDWLIPTGQTDREQWYMFSQFAGGDKPDSNFAVVLDVTPVPEPSTYAAIFGAMALGFALIRRRK